MTTTTTKSETRRAAEDASDALEKAGKAGAAAGRKAVRDAAEAGGEAVRHSSAPAVNGGDITHRTADAAEHNLQAAAGALRATVERSTEAAVGETAGTVRELTGRAIEQLGQVSATQDQAVREVTGHTRQNLDVMLRTSITLVSGFQAVMREWADTTRSVMRCSTDGLNSILHARTPQDLIAAQSELLTAEVKVLLNGSVRIAETTARAAREAAESLGDQTRQRHS